MELTACLPSCYITCRVFTTLTFLTFVEVVTGWLLSHRRFVTELIFASGNVGIGHRCRFHRFSSHAAWDPDHFALCLAKSGFH